MGLVQFGEELKQARLTKNVSLMDISSETRINQKFLEAIERGDFQILPQTYVRAFLREFALMVDLEPAEVMRKYEAAKRDIPYKKMEEPVAPQPTSNLLQENETPRLFFSPLQRNILVIGLAIIALVVIVLLTNSSRNASTNPSVTELPFDRVVKESEAAALAANPIQQDSTPIIPTPKSDSLRLDMVTTDSVWISILIDGKKAEEHLLGINKKRFWMAKERFMVTMGNAGGATFQLNRKDIGALGKRGAVVRNAVITEAILKN
jgi:hypothetical protein